MFVSVRLKTSTAGNNHVASFGVTIHRLFVAVLTVTTFGSSVREFPRGGVKWASIRPVSRGVRLMKKHWWTDETLTTDSNRTIKLRAFKGDYKVTVGKDDGSKSMEFRLDNNRKAKVEVL
ncbi:MAG: hypothetical protein COA78_37685 [Blastopirellula sp.]|nr:MAG: hypothetical protein COA78_37685 [Blastopirellula sp.]